MAKILIVEDDPFLRNAYNNVLTKESFEVILASDGAEGLELANSEDPDLIILDMLMPNMDGIEFLKAFDSPNKHPDTKIIVFSNMSIQEKINEALSLGATNYKTKAFFSPKEMVTLIRETLTPSTAKDQAA